jgi:uncharacterized protein (TIGR02145 family)
MACKGGIYIILPAIPKWYIDTKDLLYYICLISGLWCRVKKLAGLCFWSSTENQNNNSNAWYVNLNNGNTNNNNKTNSYAVRCVLREYIICLKQI